MSGEKVLVVSDSLEGPTGFATNGTTVAWSLADEYDVHVLGLQSVNDRKITIQAEGEAREITQHANLPRGSGKWDFGTRSLPRYIEELEPDILITVNDIQMINHVPNTLYQTGVNMRFIDLLSKKIISRDALMMELDSHIQRFKEKYPLDTKWILYGPQDGEPPMPQWKNIYALADKVVSFCKYGRDIYKKFYNINAPYIYHAVDSEIYKPQEIDNPKLEDKFIIGNMNSNQPRKQPVRNIKAFAKFAKDKDDVLLHMQMDWNDQFGWPLDYFVKMYGIGNKIIMPNKVGMPKQEVSKMYNLWDLNVTPTGGEGFGLTEIEGMACGTPNIATDYTTSRELTIDGKPSPRGTLIPVKELYWEKLDTAAVQRAAVDVDKLADIFNKYYYNRELVTKHGENGVKWVEKNCTMKIVQNDWKKLVKTTLNEQ